jgi:hypothetical protein
LARFFPACDGECKLVNSNQRFLIHPLTTDSQLQKDKGIVQPEYNAQNVVAFSWPVDAPV